MKNRIQQGVAPLRATSGARVNADVGQLSMKNNKLLLWQAINTLEDLFSRLGGAAQYPGYNETDIAIYVALALARRLNINLPIGSDVVNHRFIQSISTVANSVNECISQITATPCEGAILLHDYVQYYDGKIRQSCRQVSPNWTAIVNIVNEMDAQQGAADYRRQSPPQSER